MQPSIETDNIKPRFLTLPPELRNHIYRLALVKPGPVAFLCGDHELDDRAVPQLLQVCHQIRAEALPIWFGENTFSFLAIPQLHHQLQQFFTTIGAQSLQYCVSILLLGAACVMCESRKGCHVFEINFKSKTVKQRPKRAKCEVDDRNVLQPAMQQLPRIIRESNLETSDTTDMGILALQLVDAIDDLGEYFKV